MTLSEGRSTNMQNIRNNINGNFSDKVKQLNDITKILVAKQMSLEDSPQPSIKKWQKIVNNAHRQGFDIKDVKIKEVLPGRQIPDLPVKSIIAVYTYDGKEWDDVLLMITTDEKIKLAEIPLTSYMFTLNEERRGNNIKDSKRKD